MLVADTKNETMEIFLNNEKDMIIVHALFALIW